MCIPEIYEDSFACVRPPRLILRRLPGWSLLLMDVVENLLDLSGRVIAAIARNLPPHSGHSSMSSLNARLSLSAQRKSTWTCCNLISKRTSENEQIVAATSYLPKTVIHVSSQREDK